MGQLPLANRGNKISLPCSESRNIDSQTARKQISKKIRPKLRKPSSKRDD